MVTFDQITAAVESRYDYYSARAVIREALKVASLTEKKDYDRGEVASLAEAIPLVGERVDAVVARLRDLAGDGKNGETVHAPVEPAATEPAEQAQEAQQEASEEPVAAQAEAQPGDAEAASEEEVADNGDGEPSDEHGGKGRRRKKR